MKRLYGDGMKWQDPPRSERGPARSQEMDEMADELKRNPGRWALIREGVAIGSSSAAYKRRGLETAFRQRPGDPGRWDLYARAPLED